jgi:hypothetical protein
MAEYISSLTLGRLTFWITSISFVRLSFLVITPLKTLVFSWIQNCISTIMFIVYFLTISSYWTSFVHKLLFSSLDCLYVLYHTLLRPYLEHASVVWNAITSTNANKLDPIQRTFASVCFYRFLLTYITVMLMVSRIKVYILYVNGDIILTHFF